MTRERAKEGRPLHPETLAAKALHELDAATGAVVPPIHLATTDARGYFRLEIPVDTDGLTARASVSSDTGVLLHRDTEPMKVARGGVIVREIYVDRTRKLVVPTR